MKSLLILGRQPSLGLAELESLYGSGNLKPVGPAAALLSVEPSVVDFKRLGGSIKLTKVLSELNTTDWRDIESLLLKSVPALTSQMDGKIKIGISTYGLRARGNDLSQTGLKIKKLLKADGRSVRVIPNKSPVLNSAQVLHNGLTSANGCEIVAYRAGTKTLICQTVAEQDIEAYAKRDQNRPKRDAKVGMLPPKLAQILINLTAPSMGALLLDPFCGTGVVLQEASLMGYEVYGTDIEPRMVEYTEENLRWLEQRAPAGFHPKTYRLEVGDAMTHKWHPHPGVVACETYLGKPLSREPDEALLKQIMSECDTIHRGFLDNFARQAESGTRLCLAVPAWRFKNGFKHLKTLDYLRELGYTRREFKFARSKDLIYFRENQIVARELVVLEKN